MSAEVVFWVIVEGSPSLLVIIEGGRTPDRCDELTVEEGESVVRGNRLDGLIVVEVGEEDNLFLVLE